jgi:hypothetical protein
MHRAFEMKMQLGFRQRENKFPEIGIGWNELGSLAIINVP